MNDSFCSTERTTYLRIVIGSLVSGIAVVSVAISVRLRSDDLVAGSPHMIGASELVAITGLSGNPIRSR